MKRLANRAYPFKPIILLVLIAITIFGAFTDGQIRGVTGTVGLCSFLMAMTLWSFWENPEKAKLWEQDKEDIAE